MTKIQKLEKRIKDLESEILELKGQISVLRTNPTIITLPVPNLPNPILPSPTVYPWVVPFTQPTITCGKSNFEINPNPNVMYS